MKNNSIAVRDKYAPNSPLIGFLLNLQIMVSRNLSQMAKEYLDQKIRNHYEQVSRKNLLCARTRYMNMGYWKNSPETLDDACQALAELVGDVGKFGPQDHILDVGFGFGDQDMMWMQRFRPKLISGINISPYQVEIARKRVTEKAMLATIDLREGSATALPFADGSVDKVVSVEAAQNFGTREDFFAESNRVLRGGGRLVTTDIIPLPGCTIDPITIASPPFLSNMQNMYSRDVYADKLTSVKFINVNVTSIRQYVLEPFLTYLKLRSPKPNPIGRIVNAIREAVFPVSQKLDYVLVTADKP